MATWDDVSVSDPADSELVSQGASRIRAHADAARTTWDLEHQKTGEHKFPIAAPGSPTAQQIWFNLTRGWIERHDGSVFNQLNAVGIYTSTQTSFGNLLTTTNSIIGSITVNTLTSSTVVLIAQQNLTQIHGGISRLNMAFSRGASPFLTRVGLKGYDISSENVPDDAFLIDIDTTPGIGAITYNLQANQTAIQLVHNYGYLTALVI